MIHWPDCTGTLSVGGNSTEVTCGVACTPQGLVVVDFEGVAVTREMNWLVTAAYSDSATFELNVTNRDGATITSDDLLITSVSTPFTKDCHVLKLRAHPGLLNVRMPPSGWETGGQMSSVRYHTVGMQGFPGVRGLCDQGEVVVTGPSDAPDFHDLAGQIVFRRVQDPTSLGDWIAECDDRVITILRLMSFALGRFVDWSVREVFVGRTLRECRFAGPSRHGPPAEPPFHFLDLQPALDLALKNERLLTDPQSGVGEAIDWLTPWHTFAEIRFLSAITAFECLLARDDALPSTLLTPNAFKQLVRPRLRAVLSSADLREDLTNSPAATRDATVQACLDELIAKLGNLNQLSLSTRLLAFVAQYDVPLDDLPIPIEELARARHRVVHGTRSSRGNLETTGITEYASVIREVLRRTLLAILGFEGRFTSYMRDAETVTFRGFPTRTT